MHENIRSQILVLADIQNLETSKRRSVAGMRDFLEPYFVFELALDLNTDHRCL